MIKLHFTNQSRCKLMQQAFLKSSMCWGRSELCGKRSCMIGPACGLMAWTRLLQVRKTSQAALLVLLEQGLVEKGKDSFKRKEKIKYCSNYICRKHLCELYSFWDAKGNMSAIVLFNFFGSGKKMVYVVRFCPSSGSAREVIGIYLDKHR